MPPPGGALPGFGLPPGMPGAEAAAAAAAVPAAAASPIATGFSSGFSNGPAPPMIGMQIPGTLPSPSLKAPYLILYYFALSLQPQLPLCLKSMEVPVEKQTDLWCANVCNVIVVELALQKLFTLQVCKYLQDSI